MKLFLTARTKRNTAFVVLLVWLFALASGIANACLLETPEMHSNSVHTALQNASHETSEFGGLAGATTAHHDDSGTSKESCLKVCDDGTHTLLNADSGVDHTDPGPALLVAVLCEGRAQVEQENEAHHRND